MKKSLLLTGALLIVVLLSVMYGTTFLSLGDLQQILLGKASASQSLIFWNFRLPRTLIALIGGCGLAYSGFLLQGTTRNDLADGSILGINSGAGFLVLLYLGFFSQGSVLVLPILAIFGGILAAVIVFGLAFQQKQRLSMEKLLLAGIAVNAGFSALTLLVTIRISKDSYSFVTSWLAGSIWGTSWTSVSLLFPLIACFGLLAYRRVPLLPLLGLGEERAISLGIRITHERMLLLGLAAAMAASCVAFTGNLGFIGLLAPHISKAWLKKESRQSFLVSGGIGSLLVLGADILGRLLLPSGEVPAGIVIAIIGAPYFLYLLIKAK